MIKWHKNMYLAESLREQAGKVKNEIKSGRGARDLYVITLSHNPNEQLDLYYCALFRKRAGRGENMTVVGIAEGWDDAVKLIGDMAWDVYRKTGDCNLRAFFV